ncbi:MAG: methionine gamma-lyase family protein [Candidatus Eremiobacteraeota bacterium]|nr:methionine gamma-lyase family protein [Candidatus Eremiobacteraeota bacterium]
MIDFLRDRYNIAQDVLRAAERAFNRVATIRYDAQRRVKYNVLSAFLEEGLSESDFAGSTGYGYDDAARGRYESLLARIFGAEAALARLSFVSGTHAIVATLRACVSHGKTLLAISGAPYDTLRNAIIDAPHNLVAQGMRYGEVPLRSDGSIDDRAVVDALHADVAAVFLQRSRGYASRPSLCVDACAQAIRVVRSRLPEALILVDNCYGELVEEREPTHVGADAVIGSLIKNLGGAVAPGGAYVVGKQTIIDRVAAQTYAPGLGSALGPTFGFGRLFFQGLFQAALIVEQTLRGLDFCAALFDELGFSVQPAAGERRTDIVQAIALQDEELLCAFARGLQRAMPVNARFAPVSGPVPGYGDAVIMSAGSFISGSTSELSCDAPLREPYEIYVQGGVVLEHAIIGSMFAADAVMQAVRASAGLPGQSQKANGVRNFGRGE